MPCCFQTVTFYSFSSFCTVLSRACLCRLWRIALFSRWHPETFPALNKPAAGQSSRQLPTVPMNRAPQTRPALSAFHTNPTLPFLPRPQRQQRNVRLSLPRSIPTWSWSICDAWGAPSAWHLPCRSASAVTSYAWTAGDRCRSVPCATLRWAVRGTLRWRWLLRWSLTLAVTRAQVNSNFKTNV